MTTVKIISNPYEQKITYQKQKTDGSYQPIDYDNNPNSQLLKDDLCHGFFPFVAEKIMDAVIDEYQDENGQVQIVFEGATDEYRELSLICDGATYKNRVMLKRSGNYLENAGDILPEIITIFGKVKPLISGEIRDRSDVKQALDKFTDAARDVIPICVVGNYSSGKSTFINALIGNDVMPSGDEPVTAKIYAIRRSKDADRATVHFQIHGQDVQVLFAGGSHTIFAENASDDVIALIKERLDADVSDSLTEQVHTVLTTINAYENGHDHADISDMIEVTVPFVGGLWQTSAHEFVIFDTPGSNSASNEKHLQVLRKAVSGLSNGMPVYVSEYNTLDSIDNDRLIQEIKAMPGLDARFAMIVVNKADAASLPKNGFDAEMTTRLLNEAIPKRLYGEGIFFVSSVVGLGAKTDGHFSDEHSSEIYDDQEEKYSDPQNKYYKQLYRYNIMPGCQKDHALAAAKTCTDLRYVNSGLFAVEHEIQNFADHYAAYNKCHQSYKFLKKVIDITAKAIENAKDEREATRKQSEAKLASDKAQLVAKIKAAGDALKSESETAYAETMAPVLKDILDMYYQASLKDEQTDLLKAQQEERHFEDIHSILDRHAKAFGDNVAKNLDKNVIEYRVKSFGDKLVDNVRHPDKIKVPDVSKIKSAGEDLYQGARSKIDQVATWVKTNNEINETVKEELIDLLNHDYRDYCSQAQDKINLASANYWQDRAAAVKDALVQIVTEAPLLSQKRREELSEIITAYQRVDFDKQAAVFKKKDFEWPDKKMNLEKLKNAYNDLMAKDIDKIRQDVQGSHEASFKAWLDNLHQTIEANIVAYNPGLREQQEIIDRETAHIADLEDRQKKLQAYSKAIETMMTWRTANGN